MASSGRPLIKTIEEFDASAVLLQGIDDYLVCSKNDWPTEITKAKDYKKRVGYLKTYALKDVLAELLNPEDPFLGSHKPLQKHVFLAFTECLKKCSASASIETFTDKFIYAVMRYLTEPQYVMEEGKVRAMKYLSSILSCKTPLEFMQRAIDDFLSNAPDSHLNTSNKLRKNIGDLLYDHFKLELRKKELKKETTYSFFGLTVNVTLLATLNRVMQAEVERFVDVMKKMEREPDDSKSQEPVNECDLKTLIALNYNSEKLTQDERDKHTDYMKTFDGFEGKKILEKVVTDLCNNQIWDAPFFIQMVLEDYKMRLIQANHDKGVGAIPQILDKLNTAEGDLGNKLNDQNIQFLVRRLSDVDVVIAARPKPGG